MRVLISTTPGVGHVHPVVPLAQALLAAGNAVAWATGRDALERLTAEAFEPQPTGPTAAEMQAEFTRRFPEVRSVAPPDLPDFTFPRLFGAVRAAAALTDLDVVVERWHPDLVVHEAAELAGPIAAACAGIPSVTHGFGELVPAPRVASANDVVAPLWASRRLAPLPYAGSYRSGYLDIYPPSIRFVDRAHVSMSQSLGPGAYASPGPEPAPPWLVEPGAPIVYVTFGTVFNRDGELLARVTRALATLPIRVVVTVGPTGDPAALGEQPDHVHVARYLPQTALLPACAAVVSHGGSGTFLAALAAGRPQLCIPQAADQFLNAAAVARAGAGIQLVTVEAGADAVRAAAAELVADPSFAAAAGRLGEEIAAMPTPAEVAAELEARFGS